MGRQQSWDNPWDFVAMSEYNTITSLAESPVQEGLIYAGTDDGLIQVTEDGGQNWRKVEVGSIKEVPATAFVNDIRADLFDARTVYAALDNHKYGDFKPYVLKSTDAGRSWISIASNIPKNNMVWRLVQDHIKKDLLFAATEYGIYFTQDGGNKWIKLKGGLPTISFRDLTIQRRENDLVCASFGRGFFILDDYSPLREIMAGDLPDEAIMLPVKDAWLYVPKSMTGGQGASRYVAENPPFGAIISYYLPEDLPSLKSNRKKKEKELDKAGQDIPFPGWEKLDAEKLQKAPEVRLIIKDARGNLVNTVVGKSTKGIHRIDWNLRYALKSAIRLGEEASDRGSMVVPGNYTAELVKVVDGEQTKLTGPQPFEVKPLHRGALEGASNEEKLSFRKEYVAVEQDYLATSLELDKSVKRVKAMQVAIFRLDKEAKDLELRIHNTSEKLKELYSLMHGSPSKNEVGESGPPTPGGTLNVASRGLVTTYGPTTMHKQSLEIGKSELAKIKLSLEEIIEVNLPQLEKDLKEAGAPWIEGQGLIKD
jgi:hypothetical protein